MNSLIDRGNFILNLIFIFFQINIEFLCIKVFMLIYQVLFVFNDMMDL